MSYLPNLHGASRAIRADLHVLYRLSLPTEIDGTTGHLVIRFRAPDMIEGAEEIDAPDVLHAGDRVTVRVVAEKRREDDDGRTRTRPVLDEEVETWGKALFERHGVTVHDFVSSRRWRVGERGSRSFTIRDLTATVSSVTEDSEVLARGLGRGKAFGYGMPIIL
nr:MULTISPECIES: type I-E CRISPR-associated protein Cas6/Cse3/CasE [unclassified Actinomyces]